MSLPQSPITAVVAFLLADADVAGQVSTRGFGGELPRDESVSMPRKCFVVRYAGGPPDSTQMEVNRTRMDIWHYGATPLEAEQVRLATYQALKLTRRVVIASTIILSTVKEAGPITLRDPDGDWPLTIDTWGVIAADCAA